MKNQSKTKEKSSVNVKGKITLIFLACFVIWVVLSLFTFTESTENLFFTKILLLPAIPIGIYLNLYRAFSLEEHIGVIALIVLIYAVMFILLIFKSINNLKNLK